MLENKNLLCYNLKGICNDVARCHECGKKLTPVECRFYTSMCEKCELKMTKKMFKS